MLVLRKQEIETFPVSEARKKKLEYRSTLRYHVRSSNSFKKYLLPVKDICKKRLHYLPYLLLTQGPPCLLFRPYQPVMY